MLRAIRGAITVDENDPQCILGDTEILLLEIMKKNSLKADEIISIFFTATKDLNAEFPAVAVRKMGITNIPMMCANEMDVPGSLPLTIRVMIYADIQLDKNEIRHIYMKEAKRLRPDLVGEDM